LNWIERRPPKPKVASSSLAGDTHKAIDSKCLWFFSFVDSVSNSASHLGVSNSACFLELDTLSQCDSRLSSGRFLPACRNRRLTAITNAALISIHEPTATQLLAIKSRRP